MAVVGFPSPGDRLLDAVYLEFLAIHRTLQARGWSPALQARFEALKAQIDEGPQGHLGMLFEVMTFAHLDLPHALLSRYFKLLAAQFHMLADVAEDPGRLPEVLKQSEAWVADYERFLGDVAEHRQAK